MAGGLLNIASYGQQNILIYGNPKKTFFRSTYKTITNFGIQKFRIDYEGQKSLNNVGDSIMDFKIPRYADLLGKTYIVVNIPNIWSPVYYNEVSEEWVGYEFKWIENLGANLIKEMEITINGQTITKYSGEYFSNVVERDNNKEMKKLWNNMTGNIAELNDPANAFDRVNTYPNAFNPGLTELNIRPSISGRKLYIPVEAWFTSSPSYALPLAALQKSEVRIRLTFRPIRELYIIRDVMDVSNSYPNIAPNINIREHQIFNFLSPPLDSSNNVASNFNNWNTDIHLIGSYYFLSDTERNYFILNNHSYIFNDVYEKEYYNVTGSKSVDIESKGLVTGYMFRFRRSDVNERNNWSNYTNWPYSTIPFTLSNNPTQSPSPFIFTTGFYNNSTVTLNTQNILINMGILLDGIYRENQMDAGIYNYIEKYEHSENCIKDGLYMYSFALNNKLKNHQPSGAMNMDKYDNVQFMVNTIVPPVNPESVFTPICDVDGNEIGTRKNLWDLNSYNFDMKVFEERINVFQITSGVGGLKIAR